VTRGILPADRAIVRTLAERVAEIAALPCHAGTAREWTRLNGLGHSKPMVWINEIPWHEMAADEELQLRTSEACNPLVRHVESVLRRTLYQWEHMRCDMIVDPVFYSPLFIHDSGFGIREDVDIARLGGPGIDSREYHPQIDDEKDLEKIRTPVVTLNEEPSEWYHQTLVELLGDILAVEKMGIAQAWFAPWDELVTWWGVEKLLLDLVDRPELVHQAIDRLVTAWLARLDQWRELGLLSHLSGNYRVGSGGLGYTDELPRAGFDPRHVRSEDQWGCSTAQIFSSVSPGMHEEFALQYERRWLKQFGLNYYGCCEPLHNKLDALASLPNLRKVSMSPWADLDRARAKAGDRYVFSYKPNPAVFAPDNWDLGMARSALETALEQTRGCVLEVIMKDISTVRHEPHRLWEWAAMATELTDRYA
jgi:hypothetical protein